MRVKIQVDYAETLYRTESLMEVLPWYARTVKTILKNDENVKGLISTGSSGSILAAAIMLRLPQFDLLHLHTQKTKSHHGKFSGGRIGDGTIYIFVDDFIDSGASLRRCMDFCEIYNLNLKYCVVSASCMNDSFFVKHKIELIKP